MTWYMIEKLKALILNKSFLLGVVIAVGVFSRYIFGPNNILEEIDELILKSLFGLDINFEDIGRK